MLTSNRHIAIESLVAGAFAGGLAVVVNPTNPWLPETALHPGWLAALVLAAFYGLRGLLIAMPIIWAAVTLAAVALGADVAAAGARLSGSGGALPLLACLGAAGAAMFHQRKRDELDERLSMVLEDNNESRRVASELRSLAGSLQARHDRVDHSVSYWRNLAARLESGDPRVACEAALELCLSRTGARAGLVRRVADGHLQNLAWRGRWSPSISVPRDIFPDRTIEAAMARRGVVLADELEDSQPGDSDIAAAITSPEGALLGVIALRGAIRSNVRETTIADLSAACRWLSRTLEADEHGPLTLPAAESTASDEDRDADVISLPVRRPSERWEQ